jgi:hypothetical protein
MGESRVRVDGDDETQRKEYEREGDQEETHAPPTGYLNLNLNSRLRHVHVQNLAPLKWSATTVTLDAKESYEFIL